MYKEYEYKKGVWYEDENFRIDVEEIMFKPYIHVEVYNFSKSILKKIKEIFMEVYAGAYFEGYDGLYAYTPNFKFLKFFEGYEVIDEVNYRGRDYKVVKWALK